MGRGKSKRALDLIDAAVNILREIQPASVRAVCYRLFTLGLIPNMGKSATNGVSRHLVYAREQGLIDWDWIVDETRAAERTSAWRNTDEIIDAAVKGYRRDYWQDQAVRVEVWSEKGTVRGTLAPILNKYGVTFRVMHGYGSATGLHDIAEDSIASHKPMIALYVGDWDPSGLHMSEIDLPARIDRYGGAVDLRRVALSPVDVAHGTALPSFEADTKTQDPRYRWFVERYGMNCWELDALSPPTLRQRVERAIQCELDVDAWNHAIDIEQVEVASMRDFHKWWQATKYVRATQ